MISGRVVKNILGTIQVVSIVNREVQSGGERVVRGWKATTRVDTGAHRDSIHTEGRGGGAVSIVADSDHSAYVELGTRKMRGDHAGVNALNREKDSIVQAIAGAIGG